MTAASMSTVSPISKSCLSLLFPSAALFSVPLFSVVASADALPPSLEASPEPPPQAVSNRAPLRRNALQIDHVGSTKGKGLTLGGHWSIPCPDLGIET